MGHHKAALLHLLAHVRGHNGRGQGSGPAARQLAGEGVAEAHALAQAQVAVGVVSRARKGPGCLLPQLLLLLLPLTHLRACSKRIRVEVMVTLGSPATQSMQCG